MPYIVPLCLFIAGCFMFYDTRVTGVALIVAGVVGLVPFIR